jgi:hypothetical protein
MEESSKMKAGYDLAKQTFIDIINERLNRIENIVNNKLFYEIENKTIQQVVDNLKLKIKNYQTASNAKVSTGEKLPNKENIMLIESDFEIQKSIEKRVCDINNVNKNDITMELYANISASKDAFQKIKKFQNEKSKLEQQKSTLELIYNEFVKKQKEGLDSFINSFSNKINEFYQFMNPNEQFQEIRIITIGEDDELNGITIEYKYNDIWVFPPQKYFSESHMNCFGLSFFLASVVAFNKVNKFIFLDDVISSFDTNHRQRFANLLFEKFSEYQIILLTHEIEWFSYVRPIAKRKGWLIEEIKWSEVNGTHFDEKPSDLKELIELELSNSSVETLGNPIRKYLEFILKEICMNLNVKVSFRFNEVNEKRMSDELLCELKSKINKSGGQDIKSKLPVIDRVSNSSILGNLLSHDNTFNPKIGDLKAFWSDIKELEAVFYCQDSNCKRPKVSMKNYDNVDKKIRCGCDNLKYDWKE